MSATFLSPKALGWVIADNVLRLQPGTRSLVQFVVLNDLTRAVAHTHQVHSLLSSMELRVASCRMRNMLQQRSIVPRSHFAEFVGVSELKRGRTPEQRPRSTEAPTGNDVGRPVYSKLHT